jgi:beta-lactamase regulating signal transducer with metallopeptidase domain
MMPALIEASLRSLLVAVTVWAGLRAFRVCNVLAQKACWGLVLVASLLMPLFVRWSEHSQALPGATFILPRDFFPWAQHRKPSASSRLFAATVADAEKSARAEERDVLALDRRYPPRSKQPVSSSEIEAPTSSIPLVYSGVPTGAARQSRPSEHQPVSIRQVAWIVYLAMAGALCFRLFYGLAASVLLWCDAEPIPDADAAALGLGSRLRTSRAIGSPVTIGSGVVLPVDYTSWEREKLRVVLAHERSHIRQGDFYVQMLAALYASVFWFSPLGWWLKRQLSDLAETISDRAGLEQAASLSSYAQILLEFAAAPRPAPIGVAMARYGSLSRRIDRLLNDRAFQQAFAGGRFRALSAAVLVPVALYAATALVRVQAAQQVPDGSPSPAVPASPVVEPEQAANPQAPIAAPAGPDNSNVPAPQETKPLGKLTVRAPEAAPMPSVPILNVMPPVELAPRALAVPVVRIAPNVSLNLVSPLVSAELLRAAVTARMLAQAENEGAMDRGPYRYNRDSYALIRGDHGDTMNFSGDLHTAEIDKARKLAHGDFLWFRHGGKSYFIDDPSTIGKIEALYKPIEELGKRQEALGKQQEELGRQQEAIGRLGEQASIPAPDLSKEMAEITGAITKLQDKMGKNITQEELTDLQTKLAELQSRLGGIQAEMGGKRGELGLQEGRLGEEQGRLGAEQGRLGAEQGRLGREADLRVQVTILDSLENGKAHPVD